MDDQKFEMLVTTVLSLSDNLDAMAAAFERLTDLLAAETARRVKELKRSIK